MILRICIVYISFLVLCLLANLLSKYIIFAIVTHALVAAALPSRFYVIDT